jgi:ATP-dependent DNA helicase RecQ
MDKFGAEQLLQRMLANPAASFREGQWEAIDTLVNYGRKLLVVQRTGWGKAQSTLLVRRFSAIAVGGQQ